MTHAPRIPEEQLSFADKGAKGEMAAGDVANSDRRDLETEIQTGQPGDADVNLDTQGRFGNLKQNVTHQRKA